MFGRLFQENKERFIGYVRRLRPSHARRGPDETVDVVQEASADFLKKKRRVKSRTHLGNLFRRFIRGAEGDRRRRDAAAKRSAEVGPLATGVELADPATGPATAAVRGERNDELKAALSRLSPDERRIVRLRLWEDRSWADVAASERLGSEDAARMRYSRALDRLKQLLPDGEHTQP